MDPLIPAAIGLAALAALFAVLALRGWIEDRRRAREAVARRLQ
jgi:hypothetical protein